MYQLIEKSGWKLAKFCYLPVTSQPVNHSIFRTAAFGKISLEAPLIPPYRDISTEYCRAYTLHLQATT